MTKKHAIEILTTQHNKVTADDHDFHRTDNWCFQTASYIKDFFGEQSKEYNFITRFSFKNFHNFESEKSNWLTAELTVHKRQAAKFIDDCIETLTHKGLYKAPKTNFLQRFSDNILVAAITVIVPALCWVGFMFGRYTSDVQNFDLRQEVKLLKDSISISRISTINKPDNKTDTLTNRPSGKH